MKNLSSVLLTAGVAVFCVTNGAQAADLFRDGKSRWRIVHDECEKDSPIVYGVEELGRAIEKISGAKLTASVGTPAKDAVYVGVDSSLSKQDDEIVIIRLKGDSIELVGNEPRAALHAVYAFLQRELGVRWLWATESGEFMPKLERWNVPVKKEWRHTPSIRYRGFHLCGDWFQRNEFMTWMARNGMTAHRHGDYGAGEHRKGFYNYLSQTLEGLQKGNFEKHPEYFCEIGGKRLPNNVCFSSDECADLVGRVMVGTVRRYKKHPLDVLQYFLADNQDYCKCERCRKMSVSDGFFRFYNRAAKIVRQECPDVKLATLAYQQYCPAPSFPVDADLVEYASHGRCNLHCLVNPNCKSNVKVLEEMNGWSKAGVPLGEYGYNFDAFWVRDVTQPFFHIIDDQIANAVRRKYLSLIPEAGLSPRCGPEEVVSSCRQRIPELYYAWKMWDASLTADAFLDDVTRTAYGPAAVPMKRYFQTMDAAWGQDPNHHVAILTDGISHVRKILTPAAKAAAGAALAEAATKIASATDQQKAAFKREQVLFKQWTDLLDLANGNAQIVRLPRVACTGAFPKELGAPKALLTDGQAFGAEVRAAWSGERLFVEFAGVAKDVAAAELSLQAPSSGCRYRFRLTRKGERTQERKSEVGLADANYSPEWTGAFKGDRVWLSVPVAAFATLPKNGALKMAAHFALEGAKRADYPAQADVHVETVFSDLAQIDVPLFHYASARTALPAEKVRIMIAENGWKGAYTTDPKEAATLVNANQRAFWFRNATLGEFAPSVAETVRKAVHDDGAVVLFSSYCSMDVGGFLGDKSYGCKMTSPMRVPLPMRVPTSIEEGPWMKAPYDMTGAVKGRTPAYAQVPTHPELWTACCREAAVGGGEIPYLSYRRYGKGIVLVGGESLAFNVYRLLTNFLRLGEGS